MSPDQYVINGVTYIRQTTEPVKRERRKFYILIKDGITSSARFFSASSFPYSFTPDDEQTIAAELFDGEIIISKEDLDNLASKLHGKYYWNSDDVIKELKQELFK